MYFSFCRQFCRRNFDAHTLFNFLFLRNLVIYLLKNDRKKGLQNGAKKTILIFIKKGFGVKIQVHRCFFWLDTDIFEDYAVIFKRLLIDFLAFLGSIQLRK